MGGKSKKVTVGYWYYATIKAGLAVKLDEVFKILAGDKVAFNGQIKQSQGNQSIFINAPGLFGGEKSEGGIQGSLEVRWGAEEQQPSGLLRRLLGNNIPADRGYVSTVFDGKLTALNPYPKSWVYCVRRYTSSFYPEKSLISLASGAITAMNPAHMLWESYTDEDWGSSLPVAAMDEVAFKQAADTLYAEGFGLCLAWKVTDELKNFRQQVCDHIGAKLFTSRTGLITIKLIRDDYKVDDLPTFNENNGLLKLEYDNTNNTTVPSKIVVTYKDAITFKERPAMAVNLAVAHAQGGQSVQTLEFKGLPTGELANRVAYRELKIRTSSLKRYTLEFDRRAYNLDIGDAFILQSTARKVNTIVRIERVEEQFLTDGTIKVSAIQDLYGLPKVAFNPTPPIENTDPDNTPIPIEHYLIVEVPYRELSGLIDQANLNLLDETTSYIMVIAASPKGTCRNYNLASRIQGTSQFNIAEPAGDWCPMAIITHELGYLDKTIQLADAVLLEDVEAGTAAIINDEIVRIDQINLANNTITVGRGCADTVPHTHAAGSCVWFYDGFEASDAIEYNPNLMIENKLLSNTYIGQLELSDAPTESLLIKGRQGRPYAPGNLKINELVYPDKVTGGNLQITWAHRDRLLQADQLIDTTMPNVSLEVGATYNLAIYANDVLYKNELGLATDKYTLSLADIGVNTRDSCLLQFDDLADPSGKVWNPNGTPQIVQDAGAIADNCLYLDGNSYLTTEITDDFQFGSQDFTIEFWFKVPSKNSAAHIFIDMMNMNSTDSAISIYAAGANYSGVLVYHAYQSGSSGMVHGYPSGLNVLDNKWHHAAFVKYQGKILVFFDGVKKLTLTDTINYQFDPTKTKLTIGSRNAGASSDFSSNLNGSIDQVRITKKAMYTDNFIPSTDPYVFNDGNTAKIAIELEAERAGLTSWQKLKHVFKVGN